MPNALYDLAPAVHGDFPDRCVHGSTLGEPVHGPLDAEKLHVYRVAVTLQTLVAVCYPSARRSCAISSSGPAFRSC